jgi:hypothetical protein
LPAAGAAATAVIAFLAAPFQALEARQVKTGEGSALCCRPLRAASWRNRGRVDLAIETSARPWLVVDA